MQTEVENNDQRLAYALLRAVVGVNLAMHGVSRVMAGTGEFAAKLVMQFEHAPLPAWSVWAFGLTLPAIEGILGLLLQIGVADAGGAGCGEPADYGAYVWVGSVAGLVCGWDSAGRTRRCMRRCCFCGGITGGRWMRGWLGGEQFCQGKRLHPTRRKSAKDGAPGCEGLTRIDTDDTDSGAGNSKGKCYSFDCGAHDSAVSTFAQDDTFCSGGND